MKKVEMFQTEDGSLFKAIAEAKRHESLIKTVNQIRRAVMPDKYDTCDFANGHGYIQLTQREVTTLENEFLTAIKTYHKSWFDMAKKAPRGIIGRYLDDNGSLLYRTWGLLTRIDSSNRLWGQPYYANNPSEGEQIQLNK